MAFSQPLSSSVYTSNKRAAIVSPNVSISSSTGGGGGLTRPFPSTRLPAPGHVELHAQLDEHGVYDHPSISTTSSCFVPRMVRSEVITNPRVIHQVLNPQQQQQHSSAYSQSASSFHVHEPSLSHPQHHYYDEEEQHHYHPSHAQQQQQKESTIV